jgi:hypothetical protein
MSDFQAAIISFQLAGIATLLLILVLQGETR